MADFFNDTNLPSEDKEEFNFIIAILRRTDKLLSLAVESSIAYDLGRWYDVLRALYRELSCKLKKEEKEILQKQLLAINPFLEALTQYRTVGLISTNQLPRKLYFLLEELEIAERAVIERIGWSKKLRRVGI